MRVPINPETSVPTGQLGYERPVDVTAGTRALAEVVNKYAQITAEDQKKRELFDVQKRVVDETNNIQQDFEDKTKAQPLGAPNFVQQVNGEYNTRHEQMVAELKSQGYSDDAVQEFASRLGSIRSAYVAKAIDFQDKSNFAKVLGDSDQMVIGLSQYTNKNPNALGSALDEYHVALQHSGLDALETEQVYQKGKAEIIKGAQEGFAVQHPEIVLGMYGLPHELTTTSPTNLPAGQQFDLPSYINKMGGAEGTGKNKSSSAVGFGQFLDSTWLGTYKEVFGKTNETDAQILAKKHDRGIATRLAAKLTEDNVQGLAAADKPINDTTVYLAHFLGLGDAIKVLSAHADASVHGLVHDASIAANAQVFKKINTVTDLLNWAQSKMGVDGTTSAPVAAITPIPANWRGNQEDAIRELGMTAEQAATYLSTGKDTRTGSSTPSLPAHTDAPASATINDQGQTGIPVLDLSSGPDRMQMLTIARTIMNEREADAKASQREAHATWYNDFLNKLQDGKLSQGDLDAAYKSGQISDYDERKKAQEILDSKNKKQSDFDHFQLMLASGQKFNPYDEDAQKAADAGFDNAVRYSAQHGNFADPFAIALRTWQRTGILPKAGGVMIRGGLIGSDPKQVAAAASVASNMLKENPNAFAGVEGGEDIGKAAANYSHYVDDLGMTADQAAQKIALENSPEFKAKQKADEPVRNQFITTITGDQKHPGIDIEKTLNDSLVGAPGWGSTLTFHAFDPVRGSFSEPQKAEARQTYLELALDHFDKYHDPAAAQAYATRQMSRFYGVEGNRLIKYPATRAYPEIAGNRDYVYDQAKSFVDKAAGVSVPKEDIFLQPTASGSTAAAFRAGRAPPYEIHYVTREDGQPVYHYIPGKVFVADVNQARHDAAVVAQKQLQNVRKTMAAGIAFGVEQ
jgi:hypothetical protein